MADNKTKAANVNNTTTQPENKQQGFVLPPPKRVQFPQAKGKVVQEVEFVSASEGQSISINFQDKTCLNFSIVAGFTLKTDYSDFTTGEQRIVRKWQGIRST